MHYGASPSPPYKDCSTSMSKPQYRQHGTGKTINRLYPRNLIRYIVDYLRKRYLPEIKVTTYSIPSCWYILTPEK